jgi:hypothetical protein
MANDETPNIVTTSPADEDMSQEYMAHIQNTSAEAAVDALRRRVMQRERPEIVPPREPETTYRPEPEKAPENMTRRAVNTVADALPSVGAVASDVALGVGLEGGAQVIGGIGDFVQNTAATLADLGDWVDVNLGLPERISQEEWEDAGFLDRLAARPLSAVAEAGPLIGEPKTVTGGLIRDTARFLTGFVPITRALKAGGMREIPAAMAGGALTDFLSTTGMEGRLADLWKEADLPENVLTEWLASDGSDSAIEGRFKNAVEGAGLGIMADGLMMGARAIRSARQARAGAAASAAEMEARQLAEYEARYGRVNDRDFIVLGDPEAPLIATEKGSAAKLAQAGMETADVTAQGLTRVATEDGKQGVYINFARMQTPDDVQAVIRGMADTFKPSIDKARRGVQSNEETARLATDMGMTVDDLLARRKGQPFNAEEALAARRLWAASAEKLTEVAQKAADPNAGDVDIYNFRRMMAIHHAIQTEVIGARTETARALQSWSIPVEGGNVERARQIELLMEQMGGSGVSKDLARRIAALKGQGASRQAIDAVVRRGWAATSADMVKEAYVLGLLWSPATHIVNTASNTAVAFQQIYERAIAARVGNFLGSAVDDRVADGEALAMTYGMVMSLRDAFRLGAKALRTGQTGESLGKIDLPREKAISTEALSREMGHNPAEAAAFRETSLGRTVDFIGTATRVPGNVLAAEDEFFKTIGYRMELHAQSLRMATAEGHQGHALYRRMGEIVNDPPESIRLAAADAALYNTFQNRPGKWGQSIMSLRDNSGSLNPTFLVLAFVRTPTNILRYSFERTPVAPLVKQWRDDIAAGGARRDLALTRMATGSAIISVAFDMADTGLITGAGPADPGKREALMRTGWQPNSIFVDGKYYSYNRTDPYGMLLGFAATAAEQMKSREMSPEDFDEWDEITANAIAIVSASVVDKTYFTGISELFGALQSSEMGEGGVNRFINRQTGSLMPFSTASSTIERFVDPVTREVSDPWSAINARVAGLSERLPPARDLWGQERRPDEVYGRTYDVISPVAVRSRKVSPVDEEMIRLQAGVRCINKKTSFDGVDVDFRDYPEVYDAYVRLAGNELKHPAWGLGAKDFLDAVVTGNHPMSEIYRIYSDGPDGGKAAFISNTIAQYRQLARQEILKPENRDLWPEFIDYYEAKKDRAANLKMPVIPGSAPITFGQPRLPN